MVHICDICDYNTTRLNDFDRHKQRKRQCTPNSGQISIKDGINTAKVEVDDCVVVLKVNIECSKCSQIFTRKDHMRKHEKTCDGLHKLQCKTCLKMSNTNSGKYQHKKNVKCMPSTSLADEPHITNIPQSVSPLTSLDYYFYKSIDPKFMRRRSFKEYLDQNLNIVLEWLYPIIY